MSTAVRINFIPVIFSKVDHISQYTIPSLKVNIRYEQYRERVIS